MVARINSLLVRCEDGFFAVNIPSQIVANGRREGFLSLSGDKRAPLVRLARRLLDVESRRFVEITVGVLPREGHPEDEPITEWGIGDRILVPDERGALGRAKVRAVTFQEDDDGQVEFIPELSDIRAGAAADLRKAIERMASGAGLGLSRITATAGPGRVRPPAQRLPRAVELPPFTFGGVLGVPDTSPRYRVPMSGRITEITARIREGSATVQVRRHRGGSTTSASVSVSAGVETTAWWGIGVDPRHGDQLDVYVSSYSTGSSGLAIQPAFAPT